MGGDFETSRRSTRILRSAQAEKIPEGGCSDRGKITSDIRVQVAGRAYKRKFPNVHQG